MTIRTLFFPLFICLFIYLLSKSHSGDNYSKTTKARSLKFGQMIMNMNIFLFPKRNQAQEGCSERPIGHLMSAAPNRIKTCTGKFVAMVYKR